MKFLKLVNFFWVDVLRKSKIDRTSLVGITVSYLPRFLLFFSKSPKILIFKSFNRFPLFFEIFINPLTPKITDFLTHFCPLLPKRKREYIITKPCILSIFGSPFPIYKVKITLPCTGKSIWLILFKKLPKI